MKRKILSVIFTFSMVCLFLLGLIYLEAEILSGVRSYVRGEGMYAKGEKDAVIALIRFTNTKNPKDFEAYQKSLLAPQGDRIAREALQANPPDKEKALEGFAQGLNTPTEIPSMINLFLYFNKIPFMEKAIDIWTRADKKIEALDKKAYLIKAELEKEQANKELLDNHIKEVYQLSADLARLEIDFSLTISDGANLVKNGVLVLSFSLSGLIFIILFFYMRKILQKVEHNESELIRREAEQRSLFRALPDLIWVKDAAGIYLRCNRRFEDLFGAREEEIVGKTDYDFVDEELATFFRENDLRAIEKGMSCINEEEVTYASDGHKEYLETIKTPLYDSDGKIIGVLGIGRDLSQHIKTKNELKKHQEELEKLVWERTKELESMVISANSGSRAKSEFLANMSHEIRTPMTSIIGMTSLALRTRDDEKKRAYIEKSNESATSLLGLINDILDFSKIEAGKLEVENIFFNLNTTINNIENLLRSKIEEKQQKLNVQIDPDVPLNLVGDPLRIGQILLNLLSNAAKFTPEGGVINVRVREIESDSENSKLLFNVEDNGIGISSEFEEKIFDAFDQADNSFSRKYGGTGLGLAICKRLVNLMGGEISFENNSKGGATFNFTVSLKNICVLDQDENSLMRAQKNSEMEDALHSIDGLEILLVDDTPDNQEVISEFLEMEGARVTVASNGLEAIEILKSKTFDGVLMDCQMPIMDGYEAAQRIRHELHFTSLPIVAITGNVMKEDIEKTKMSGMNDFIAKPIQMDDFYLKVARWMNRKKSA